MAEEAADIEEKDRNDLSDYQWMVRPCDVYKGEYSDCTAIKSRFHQYFVHGHSIDCNSWKVDYDNCTRWKDDKNIKAYKELIKSEEKRRMERLAPHYRNDTWKRRTGPPLDWDKALPAWLEEENKNTFLAIKSDEMKNHGQTVEGERSLCVIS